LTRLGAESTRLTVRASEHATYRAIAPRAANQRAESIREKASRRVALRENVTLPLLDSRRESRRLRIEDRFTDATRSPGFSRREFAAQPPRLDRHWIRVAPVKPGDRPRTCRTTRFSLSLSLFLSRRRRIFLLLLSPFTSVSLRERCECTNQRTHAPRSVATAVGAGRCLQSNCGGSSTVAPPKDAAVAATTTTATTTAFDRPPPFFCPSRRVRY